MRRPSLAELAQLAEIIAAVAVVISLVYVGVGVRGNTSAVRSASGQAITNTSLDALSVQAASPDLARIRRIGDTDYAALDEEEQFRYYLIWRQVWLTFQNVYLQRDLGVIGAELWGTYHRVICTNFARPGPQATWPVHAGVLDPSFVALVEECLDP